MASPQIFILPEFKKTFERKGTSQTIINAINNEMKRLALLKQENMLFEYLNNQNGKKLQGHEHQFKYRLSSGDRIFYTYGCFVDGIKDKEEDKNSIVIYGYSKHDDQDKQRIPKANEYFEPEIVTEEDFKSPCFKNSSFKSINDVEALFNNFPAWRQTHAAYVMDSLNIGEVLDDVDVYLSDEQDKIVSEFPTKLKPLLILGGAGTGKTIMALHILNDFKSANPNSKCIYFTQSDALRGKAYSKYTYIVGKNTDSKVKEVEFKNINRFCIEFYNKKQKDKLTTDSEFTSTNFYEYADNNISNLNRMGINSYDLWAEIRGTIKGGLSEKWQRPHIFSTTNFNKEFIRNLEDKNLIKRVEEDQRLFYITDFNKCHEFMTINLEGQFGRFAEKILDNGNEVDCDTHLLSEHYYFDINEENSTLPKEDRKKLYEITKEYQSYLSSNKLFDDNDLVMKLLSCQITEEDKYDFIVIDEIQDYTELQIYAILSFAKNSNCIVMAGDQHQIINPTIFNVSRIRQYFNSKNIALDINKLKRNFRCPNDVVKIANIAAELSNEYIARQNNYEEEKSEFITEAPLSLKYSSENLKLLIKTLIDYPSTVVLVPTEKIKNEIIDSYGRTEYLEKNNPIVNTVSEIKGMEYKYVVAYNLISYFNDSWIDIFNNRAKKQTRFRYYFNIFYVAITRTQRYLCFIESDENLTLYEKIKNIYDEKIKNIQNVDISELRINELNNDADEWLHSAKEALNAGNYENAKVLLNHVPDSEEEKKIISLQCDMKQALNNKDFETCVKIALLLNDSSLEQYLEDARLSKKNISKKLENLVTNFLYPNKLTITYDTLVKNINEVYKTPEYIEYLIFSYINKFGNYIFNTSFDILDKQEN